MLLFDAEEQKMILKDVDINYMENYKALEQLKDFENLNQS